MRPRVPHTPDLKHTALLVDFPPGGVEGAGPESPPLQPKHQAVGGEVHPLPSSG